MSSDWTADWTRQDLKEATGILGWTHRQLVMVGSGPVEIPRYPDDTDDQPWASYLEPRARYRLQVASTLVRVGALVGVEKAKNEWGQEKEALLVHADLSQVKAALAMIEARLNPPRPPPARRPGKTEESFKTTFGTGMAWISIALVVILLLVLLVLFVPGFRTFILEMIEAIARGQGSG